MVELGAGRMVGVLLSTALVTGGCTVRPPMDPGVPLRVKQGHCMFVETQFKQRGVARDRDSVLEQLSKEPRSAHHVEAGKLYHVGRAALSVAAGVAGAVGTLSASGDIEMSTEAATAVWIGGLGSLVGAWVFCDAGERSYAAAAKAYSAPLPREPDEAPEPAAEDEGLPPPLPGSDLK